MSGLSTPADLEFGVLTTPTGITPGAFQSATFASEVEIIDAKDENGLVIGSQAVSLTQTDDYEFIVKSTGAAIQAGQLAASQNGSNSGIIKNESTTQSNEKFTSGKFSVIHKDNAVCQAYTAPT